MLGRGIWISFRRILILLRFDFDFVAVDLVFVAAGFDFVAAGLKSRQRTQPRLVAGRLGLSAP
jgi:hypothetical protein